MAIRIMVAAVAAWLCAPGAQADVCRQVGSSSIQTVVVSPQETEGIEGVYQLSNGRRLALLSQDDKLYADFGKWSPILLQEVEPNQFWSTDGAVRLTFLPGRREDSIVVSYPADSRGRLARLC